MAILLSLVTAAVFGIGDFYGGMAAKRARVIQVVAGSHLVGAVGALVAALLVAEQFDWGDVGLGAIGGAFGMGGVVLLYRRLSVGPMSVVAPLTAITSAVVPAAWGIIGGERLSLLGWIGIGIGLLAVTLVSITPDSDVDQAPVTPAVIGESLLAGTGFGAMFIFLDATSAESAPWPVVGARVFTSSMLIITILIVARRTGSSVLPEDRGAWPVIALVGLLDTGSNVTFVYASNLGQLSVVGVLSALYPISTVILARVVLGERMTKVQGAGCVAALAATELLVLS